MVINISDQWSSKQSLSMGINKLQQHSLNTIKRVQCRVTVIPAHAHCHGAHVVTATCRHTYSCTLSRCSCCHSHMPPYLLMHTVTVLMLSQPHAVTAAIAQEAGNWKWVILESVNMHSGIIALAYITKRFRRVGIALAVLRCKGFLQSTSSCHQRCRRFADNFYETNESHLTDVIFVPSGSWKWVKAWVK